MKISTALSVIATLAATGYSLDTIVGVAPKDQSLYKADANGKWRCLKNPEIELDFAQINDDYCDCPDGSDEPGTSACPKGMFYCENKGHLPSYIKSSLVNDGRCDYSLCCDGSDEWNASVECPNRCEEIHKEYEKQLELANKVYKIGSGKAETILKAAKRLRDKLEENLASEENILVFVNRELETYKDRVEKMEQKDSKNRSLEKEIKNSVSELEKTLNSNFDIFTTESKNLRQVKRILDNLLKNFNPNLNDNAVKKVVEDFQTHLTKFDDAYKNSVNYKDLLYQATKELKTNNFNQLLARLKNIHESFNTGLKFNSDITERSSELEKNLQYLIDHYNPNFNDASVKDAVKSFQDYLSNKPTAGKLASEKDIQSLSEKVSDLVKSYGKLIGADIQAVANKGSILNDLKIKFHKLVDDFLGVKPQKPKKSQDDIVNTDGTGANVPAAEVDEFLRDLQKNRGTAEEQIHSLKYELSKDLGPNDILRPFNDVSVSAQLGEYGYELFFTGEVRQKGRGNHNVKIGTYSGYEVKDIDDKRQQFTLRYTNGQKCWNGPSRSAVVTIDCGESNEIIAVSEPEKCEYHFRVKAPIGCKPPSSEVKK